jgi:predicted RND superfamily exporter protein
LDGKFVFMNNQSIYVRTAIQSSILGVIIAFVVLLISTRVFHIALFASLSITSVLVSVVGTMVMLGWKLGSIESILIGITAGFSVDYVVHLAHAYEIAEGDSDERVTEAFADLGISVFNGMITSVAASIPLFFCSLQFFAKFGTFLCLTIVFSWIFANFVFMSILAQMKIPIKKGKCRL